jgi:diguanylate cyclase (GGDEF)-like protein
MKQLVFAAAMIFAAVPSARALSSDPPTSLRDIVALTNDQVRQHPVVSVEATVTYYFRPGRDMDLQDGDFAIFSRTGQDYDVAPGDRVLVKGTVEPGYLPFIRATSITLLRHDSLPKSVPASFSDLVRTRANCRLVKVRGIVRTADLVPDTNLPSGRLQLLMDGGYVEIQVNTHDLDALRGLLDAQVEVTGAAGRLFDSKRQETGAKIKVTSFSDIHVLKPPAGSPWSLPAAPFNSIMAAYNVHDLSQRVRVHGTITYYEPGSAVVIESGAGSLWISTQAAEPLRIGDAADAIGFPATDGLHLTLNHAEIEDSHLAAPVQPQVATWDQLAVWAHQTTAGHEYDLVTIEGRVLDSVREAVQDEYVLETSDGRLFSAIYHHPPLGQTLPAMLKIPAGSTVRITGICTILGSGPLNGEAPFNILLRSFDDIAVVAPPSWFDLPHLMILAGLLVAIAVVAGVRGWLLETKTRREIGSLAYVEQRRGKILEDINNSEPLAEILERITELVSVRLNGAPCWCQIADGATLGNCPAQLAAKTLRPVEYPIAAREGPPLGTIFVAFDARTKPIVIERQALAMAAGLATLAIETSRLYNDLVRRSEFDVLTDVQNRFAMEKTLDAMIHDARQSAGLFAVIFIDLNEFKQVNDVHGHLVGDMYLQEVARRMKRQLRPGDTLGRIGGDEFAVLVPDVHNRAEVEEIALRLGACFEPPFTGEGFVLQGSASIGIALYPDDATSALGLLRTADSAMYTAKYTRAGKLPKSHREREFRSSDLA